MLGAFVLGELRQRLPPEHFGQAFLRPLPCCCPLHWALPGPRPHFQLFCACVIAEQWVGAIAVARASTQGGLDPGLGSLGQRGVRWE